MPPGASLLYDFQRWNMAYNSEGPVAAQPTRAGTPAPTDGTGSDGFSGWWVFAAGAPTASQAAYVPYPGTQGSTTYNVSCFVRMDDGSAPNPGNQVDATTDFSLVAQGSVTNNATYNIVNLGGGLYRVSNVFTTPATPNLPNNWGVARYTTQSGKGMRVTGIQITPGKDLLAYMYDGAGQPVVDRSVTGQNLFPSDDFTDSRWIKNAVVVNPQTTVNGQLMNKVVDNATLANHQTHWFSPYIGYEKFRMSFDLAPAEFSRVAFGVVIYGPNTYYTGLFQLVNGVPSISGGANNSGATFTHITGSNLKYALLANGCYRISVDIEVFGGIPGVTQGLQHLFRLYDNTGSGYYTGDGTAPGLYLARPMKTRILSDFFERPPRANTMGTTINGSYVDSADPKFVPQGLTFDGATQFMTITNPPMPTAANGFTVLSVQTRTVAAGAYAGIWSSTNSGWYPRLLTDSQVPPRLLYQSFSGGAQIVTSAQITVGVPFFAAVTQDGAGNGRVQVNLNPPSTSSSLTFPVQAIGQLGVGARSANTYWWGGTLHYYAVYDRVLSDAEVAQAYRAIKRQLGPRGVALP